MSKEKARDKGLTDNQKIEQVLHSSGHDFHIRIANILRAEDWQVTISPYYSDPATNLSREVDLIAKKQYPVNNLLGNNIGNFTLRLFIECKYLTEPTLFWFEAKDYGRAKNLLKSNGLLYGAQDYYLEGGTSSPAKPHHYLLKKNAAKLWQVFNSSKDKPDSFYQAMNGSLNALIFQREHSRSGNQDTVDYPVIIINDLERTFRREPDAKSGFGKITNHFQIEVNYSYINRISVPSEQYFLLDVIDQNNIPVFLSALDDDATIYANYMREKNRT
ncbi:MAG: hypothetical protein WCW31_03950 [Patescibacteria group bacterium]|jgi:hypothetical protein